MLTAATATATPLPADNAGTSVSAADFNEEPTSYIVLLNDAPLASYSGTAPAAGEKLDVTTSAATSYAAQLAEAQDSVLASVDVKPTYRYDTVLNGFAATLTAEQAAEVANNPAVKSVSEAQWQELHSTDPDVTGSATPLTDESPDFLGVRGAGGLWEQLGGAATAGEGLVVGVLDTGLAYDNESFTEGTVGAPPADWAGDCDTGEDGSWPADACSNKVIGANYFVEGLRAAGGEPAPHEDVSPSDVNGHGSHTAGTAAGFPLALSDGTNDIEISGMAPAAHISVYKVCWDFVAGDQEGGTCMDTDSAAAIEKAVEDGVDVLNYSIGSPTDNEYNNGAVAEAFRNAAAAGVYSAVSAGNSGPEGNPPNMYVSNNAPWVTTVAAATHRDENSPVVAGFSSRGPVQRPAAEQNLLKPDLGAPGVDVLAAVPGGWAYMSGTSMASPHIAGLALLMKQGHPDWSPMAVKSAMQTTTRNYTDAMSNDPFNGGVGFVAPKVFLNPGLVFDSGPADWEAFEADYTTGYNFNTASLQIGALGADGPTEVTRTVTNVTDAEVSYTAAFEGPAGLEVKVTPETVTIPAGGSADVTIAVRNVDAAADVWQKGTLSWTGEGQPTVTFPVIARGEQAPPGEEPPPPPAPEVERVFGANRYETADAVSDLFPDGVDTVYLASGENYPDAMTGAPAAAQGKFPEFAGTMETPDGNAAPVLLAKADKLTKPTEAALEELAPSNVVILGGTGIINQDVEDGLAEKYTVSRVDGENRYDTAANLAKMYPSGLPVVYVASGVDDAYPDALTGSALAGANDAPVLLTKTDEVPQVTLEALEALNPGNIVVIGGEGAVSQAAYDQLGASERISGANRWETAAEVSAQNFGTDVPVVYIADGRDFPDALAGSALAGSQDVPVLISKTEQVPQAIWAELDRLSPERVVIVGGTAAISQEVEDELNKRYPGWIG
ncbi:cell wall-binding repeat-containing protein [Ornithinimicrobium cavernae]|uniref:cell wall-binding repeat-containing protein n=1 Tax=Ornithinimicrobium cavernae TaxID=2666047 RepID=UPI00137A8D5D|nr:cell wall-binding repeat-containing protein [Ornithinimicrobium cavernae]